MITLEYQNINLNYYKYNNKEVAIYSRGDLFNEFIDVLIKYANRDILVLAYSEKFYKELNKMIGNLNYHCVIPKSVAKSKSDTVECETKNEFDCDEIIKELNR